MRPILGAVEMGDGLAGSRKVAGVRNLALEQGRKHIDRAFWRVAEIVELFQCHFVPINEGGQPFV